MDASFRGSIQMTNEGLGMSLKASSNHQVPRMPDPTNNLSLLNNQHMAQQQPGGPRIFLSSQLESRDDLDERHERCFSMVMTLVAGKSEKEAFDGLTVAVCKDPRAHEDICLGLVVSILANPSPDGEMNAGRCFRDLTLICRDGFAFVLSHLTHLVLEKYLKLLPHSKQQLMWIIRELVRASVQGMDSVVWNLMRQIAGGDVNRGNLWLADSLLDLFMEHKTWLEKFPFLVASVAYTYLRLVEDHVAPQFEKLREKEIKFVVALIRDRFTDVMAIGRDFVRILQYVARLPEVADLWRDILYHPKVLSPAYTGFSQLMETRTSRRFMQCRITPEMEKKLVFLTSQVKFGSHKRYQDWFQRQYLSTPESQSLRCDLIRFIVGVIHPTNELLCSDIIPRWAVIGWLLTTCTSQVAASNAKLALFYDWLYFEPDKDNIMNIEPAILVMHHSIKPHPAITATLLDFLCRIITNFFPREQEKVRNGIYSSLKQILEKRVLPSLSPLFDNPKMDQELKFLLRERFAPFVNDTVRSLERTIEINDDPVAHFGEPMEDLTGGPVFSDDEADVKGNGSASISENTTSNKKVKKKSNACNNSTSQNKKEVTTSKPSPVKVRKRPVKQSHSQSGDGNDAAQDANLGEHVKQLLSELKSATITSSEDDNMVLRTEEEEKCEIMDQLIRVIISEDFSLEQCSAVASRLSAILLPSFKGKIFPENPNEEALEDSVGKPIFVAFRALCDLADGEGSGILLQVLADLYALQPRIGYYLLYFLSVDKQAKQRDPKTKATIYKDLFQTIDDNYMLDICLVNDMRQCQEDDVQLFVHLIPDVYTIFPKTTVGNLNLVYLIVSCVDGRQIQELVCSILFKDLLLFKKDTFASIVTGSLSWETFEQCALWQLIGAHDVPIDCLVGVLPKLNYEKHPEALTAVLLRLRTEKPSADLVRHLLVREHVGGDRFVSTCLGHWLFEHEDKLADLISSYLMKQTSVSNSSASSSGSSSLKRKRGAASSGSTTGAMSRKAEIALSHIDDLRQNCTQYEFFLNKNLQKALQTVRQLCTDEQKKKFMDLFAIAETESDAEEEDEDVTFNQKYSSPSSARKAASASSKSKGNARGGIKKAVLDDNELTSESSESENSEDEDTKPLRKRGGSVGKTTKAAASSNSRKRAPASKVSYKGMESSENSSDDENTARKKKRRKKAAHSDSD